MKPRHVFVRWADTTGNQGWVSKREARKDKMFGVWSSGFVVADTKMKMVLAQNYGDDHNVNGRETIPRGCILKVVENPVPFTVPGLSEES